MVAAPRAGETDCARRQPGAALDGGQRDGAQRPGGQRQTR